MFKTKSKKLIAAIICAALLIAIAVVVVYAIVTMNAEGSSDNEFTAGKIDCAVNSDGTYYRIQNTGNTDAYIRATVLVNWRKDDKYLPKTTTLGFTSEDGWENNADTGIYYYNNAVAAGEYTSKLVVDIQAIKDANSTAPDADATLEIRVFAEAIQVIEGKSYSETWAYAESEGTVGTEIPTAPEAPDAPDAACSHEWKDATCTTAKICSKCGYVEGVALGHSWTDATCTAPKTCSVCGETEGDALGHNYVAADGDYKCSRCEKPLTLDELDVSATDLQANMQNIFGGGTVFQETVMFLNPGETKQLLFPIDEIVAVQSYDGFTTYVEGRDYELVDGKLHIPVTSTIKLVRDTGYYNIENPVGNLVYENYNGSIVPVLWGDGITMTQWQLRVIYKHSVTWEGFKQPSYISQYEGLIKKLMMGEDVTFIFYGDSITCGSSSSWYYAIPTAAWYNPNEIFYQWSYSMLFTQAIADMFGYTITFVDVSDLNEAIKHHPEDYVGGTNGTITYINSSVGGWTSAAGLNNFDVFIAPYMEQYGCDLFGVAFGMNDLNEDAITYTAANVQAIYDKAMAINDDFYGLVISSMSPNNILANLSANKYTNFAAQETNLQSVVDNLNANGHSSGLVQMSSMSYSMLDRIDFRSYSSNNYNHPNDFMERVYAQTCLQAFIGYENIEEIPEHDHAEVTIPSKAATCFANGLTEGKMCSICYEITDAPDVIAPIDHTLSNGVCTVCNETISYDANVLASVASGVSGVTATVVDDHVNFALSGTDPTVTLYDNSTPLKRYMLIRYRGNGSGYGTNYDFYLTVNGTKLIGGKANNANWFNLNLDDQWHYIIVDLGTADVTSLTWTLCDGTVTAAKGNSFDVEYVEFYDSYAEAKAAEVSRYPDGNIYPSNTENGSSGAITAINVPTGQVYYVNTATGGFYTGNKTLDVSGKNLVMDYALVKEGYGNILVTVALSGTYDYSTLALQINDGPIAAVAPLVPVAGTYWVPVNVSGQLAVGETGTLKVLISNPNPTISEETILVLETFTITITCEHNWVDATCTSPKTCSTCGTTEEEALGHSWTAATCTTPKTCSKCYTTDGEALGHSWTDATCTAPKTCSVCGETEGSKLGHDYSGENNTCIRCGQAEPDTSDVELSRTEVDPYSLHKSGSCGYIAYDDATNIVGYLNMDSLKATAGDTATDCFGGAYTQGMTVSLSQTTNSMYNISGWVGLDTTNYEFGWSIGLDDERWGSCAITDGVNDPDVLAAAKKAGCTHAARFVYYLHTDNFKSGETIHLLVKDKDSGLIYCFAEFDVVKYGDKSPVYFRGTLDNFVSQTSGVDYKSVANSTGIVTFSKSELSEIFNIRGWLATDLTDYSFYWRLNEELRNTGFTQTTEAAVQSAAEAQGYTTGIRFIYYFGASNVNSGDKIYLYVKDNTTGDLYCFAEYTIIITDSASAYTLSTLLTTWDPVTSKAEQTTEDENLKLYFDHLTEKTDRYDTSKVNTGASSYTIQMAKNEMEGCHFYLYYPSHKKITIKLSDFTHTNGKDTIPAELGVEFYIEEGYISVSGFTIGETVDGKTVGVYPDAVVPYASYINANYGSDEGGYYMDSEGNWQSLEYGAYVNLGPYCYKNWDTETYPLRDTVRGFTIQATTTKASTAGQYSATVEIYDYETGNLIKTATVYTYVYDVTLNDEPALDTAIGIWGSNYLEVYNAFGGYTNNEVMMAMADFMLQYRMTPNFSEWWYTNVFGTEWMYNPRVTTVKVRSEEFFNTLYADSTIKSKLFYYGQDEPCAPRNQQRSITLADGTVVSYFDTWGFLALLGVAEEAEMLQSWGWEDYRLVAPFERNPDFTNLLNYPSLGFETTHPLTWEVIYGCLTDTGQSTGTVNEAAQALYNKYKSELENSKDMVDFLDNYLTVWVYTFTGSTPKALSGINGCMYMHTEVQDSVFGEYLERMKKYQAQGDELWSYVACEPEWDSPYQNILLFNDGTEARTMFWTTYKLGQTGFLYWREDYYPGGTTNTNTYTLRVPFSATGPGDGILFYPGAVYGQLDPIPSIRFINMRDGIEDYELLCMLESAVGKDAADAIVNEIVTSTVTFTRDDDKVYDVHANLLKQLEAALSSN